MSNFQANTKSGGRHRHRVLLACAAVLIVASVGFAAAGGLEIVRGWFTVTTAVNGEVVDVQTVTTDEDGKARFAMPDIDDPGELSFTVGGEVVGPTDANTATIDIAVQDGVGEMTVTYDEPEED